MKCFAKYFCATLIFAGIPFALAEDSQPSPSTATAEQSESADEDFATAWERIRPQIESATGHKLGAQEPLVKEYAESLFERSQKWNKISADTRENAVAKLSLAYFLMRGTDADGQFVYGADPVEAVSALEDTAQEFATTPFGAEALYLQCVLLTILHQYEWAFDRVRAINSTYPGSERIGDALAQGYLIAESMRAGARPRRLKGRLPWLKDRKMALRFYDELYALAPKSSMAPWLLFRKGVFAAEIAEEWFESERRNEAISAFEMLITIHPESPLVPDAYLNVAKAYEALCIGAEWDQVSARRALNYYTDFCNLFPEHEQAEFAYKKTEYLRELIAENRNNIGDFYYVRRNNLRAALVFYNEAITASPNSAAGKYAKKQVEKIRRGERAPLTVIDWLFGRYPPPSTRDFSDAPSDVSLDRMGFQSASSPEDRSRGTGDSDDTSREEPETLVDPEDR